MKLKSIISTALLATLLVAPGCKDDFADLNTDPSKVTEANIPYLYTRAVLDFEPSGYLLWFYNGKYTSRFVQAFVPTGGLEGNFNEMGATGDQGEKVIEVLKIAREIDFQTSLMTEEDAAQYVHIRAMLDPLLVYLGLFDSDTYGDRPFTNASKAQYTDPPLLTPEYDKLEDLYDLWLGMLDNTIKTLSNDVVVNGNTILQDVPPRQEIIYGGDRTKWCKFANSLKVKIAVRLLHVDKARALKIAEEAVNSEHGVMSSSTDDMLFNKGLTGSDGDKVYHFGDNAQFGAGQQLVVNFLLDHQDPRVRFFYKKNDFNSKVVQGFLDQGVALPSYIEQYVEYTDATKKTFKEWKEPGEPWIRYHGLPADIGAAQLGGSFNEYFNSNLWKLDNGDSQTTYYPYSAFQEEMIRGRIEYTIPTKPGDDVIKDTQQNPWYGAYLTTAEVKLYLAELSLLGANVGNAATLFQEAVKASVETYDRLASLNKIPYYGTTYGGYDPFEAVIDLDPAEIDDLLQLEPYQLTGNVARDLEKIYIQQYLHFMLQPTEQFVSVRRSGVPKIGSDILPWRELINSSNLPRRMEINNPSPTDLMYDNIKKAMERQGFTTGNGINPALLNSERVWYDKNAPQFGAGPNF